MVFVIHSNVSLWKPSFSCCCKRKWFSSCVKFWLIDLFHFKRQEELHKKSSVVQVWVLKMGPKENNRPNYTQWFLPLWNHPLLSSFQGLDRRWILFLVTILHGTFSPSVRILFDLPHAPDSALFNTLRLLLSSSLYLPLLIRSFESIDISHRKSFISLFQASHSWLFAGMELGVWVFLGNVSQVVGLETTSASRAAFLVQLQTLFVPIISSWFGYVSSRSDRFASILSILGVAILSSSKSYSSSNRISFLGDGLEIAAAAFFSVYVIRLGHHARLYSSISLSSIKVITQAMLSMIWLLWDIIQTHHRNTEWHTWLMTSFESLQSFFHSDDKWIFIWVILWTGIIISFVSTLLQTFGQQRVSSSDAAIIYATQPLWACMFSFLLLHETFQTSDWLGGLFILGGTFVSAKKLFG
ncbi:hypothetical protein GpartN1_g1447.t1 [Galdieria partita]|uniref:EamA domain-containing protein n=1 Tax=Galdieria partita TaxID=83374 RepID=A0A9C7UNL9_9RHOD|nr:hypothetical protein GpartN1_g1447.t1 [Galdieria partita]